MVTKKALARISLLSALLLHVSPVFGAINEAIPHFVSADACDDLLEQDSAATAENRAVDKAGLSAVKLSGLIQQDHADLPVSALDLISYRIIDEYMMNATHEVTFKDSTHVCVKLKATILMTKEELEALVQEYREKDSPNADIKVVAEKVKENTAFKPHTLNQKKLLYIAQTELWNGTETNHYQELLNNLFKESSYYFMTNNADLADYVITPKLVRAEVDEIDAAHHKMQMQIQLNFSSVREADFEPLNEQQTHFILFAADKDEQEIADKLLQKLFSKAAEKLRHKIEQSLSKNLEIKALRGENS